MSHILSSDSESIDISFPDEKFQNILRKLHIQSKGILEDREVNRIFLTAVAEFKIGNLALDEMSEIAERLWFDLEDKGTKLADALHLCAELNFYVRHILELREYGNFTLFMEEVMKYYEQHKSQI